MQGQRRSAQLWWLGAAVLLSAAMLLGRYGVGTYSPAGLALVAIAIFASVQAIRAQASGPAEPVSITGGHAWVAVGVIMLLHIGLGVAALRWTPPERVDVYLFQRDAAAALLHGINPYTITHRNLYVASPSFFYGPDVVAHGQVNFGFQYPPLSLLFILPGYLAGDLRYSCLAAMVVSAALLACIRRSRLALVAIIVLLLNAVTFYVLSRGWTEPLVLLMLCWTCLAAVRRSRWLPVALGALFASKQYAVLAAPLAALLLTRFSWKAYWRLLAQAAGVALLVTAPFALWNWHHFWRDVVVWQLIQPFRPDALSFSVLGHRLGLPLIPQAVVLLATAAAAAWTIAASRRGDAGFAGSFALVFLVFFCLNKQAFVNYYFLVIGAMVLAAVTAEAAPTPRTVVRGPGECKGLKPAGAQGERTGESKS